MPERRSLDIRWPLAGLDRSAPYRGQAPFSTPSAQNVRPADTIEDRARGGSRPGVDKAFYDRIGGGDYPVRMLEKVAIVDDSGYTRWVDNFEGTELGDGWTAASWLDGPPGILPDDSAAASTDDQAVGAVGPSLTVDGASTQEIAMWIAPYHGSFAGKYQLFGRMATASPAATTDGFVAELVMDDDEGTFSGTLAVYKAGALTATYDFTDTESPITASCAGWFTVNISSADSVSVRWLGHLLLTRDISDDLGGSAARRFGFGLEATNAGGICLAGAVRCIYYKTGNSEAPRELLVASANGELWHENVTGMSKLTTTLTLADDRRLEATDLLQKLYIADYGPPVASGTNGTVVTKAFDSASYTDWTAVGANAADYVLVLSGGTGGLTAGTYTIASIAAGAITLDAEPGNDTGITFSLERAPKVYDPAAGTLTLLTAASGKGQVPSGSPYCTTYRGRLCFAKDHVCYQSRVDEADDWYYPDSPDDPMGAVASTAADSDSGQIGDLFTALHPLKDDYLLYGCRNSIWVQEGDINLGGQILNVTRSYGVLPGAVCSIPGGGVAMMTQDGLKVWGPGMKEPEDVSNHRLPRELQEVDTDVYNVSLVYDIRERGIRICLTGVDAATNRWHWWLDWDTKSFWPEKYPGDSEPFALCRYNGHLAPYNTVVWGCRDGYLRMSHESFETDGTEEIESYVVIGPVKPGTDLRDGSVDMLVGVLDEDSGDVDWAIRAGETHEASVHSTADAASGTWEGGLNYRAHPRVRSGSFVLRLSNGGARRWALERISAVVARRGAQRKG